MLSFVRIGLGVLLSVSLWAETPPEVVAQVEKMEDAQSDLTAAIQPRSEGSTWLYTSILYEDGRKYPAGSSKEEVIAVKEIDGVTCYKVRLTLDWRTIMDKLSGQKLTPEDYSYYWEYFTEKGSYHYAGEEDEDIDISDPTSLEQFDLTMPYPVEKGHSYTFEEETYTVVATEEVLEVPAGKFSCVIYQIDFDYDDPPITRERFYMSPGVGLVRWEEQEKVDGKWEISYQDDLIKYDLKVKEAEPAEPVE